MYVVFCITTHTNGVEYVPLRYLISMQQREELKNSQLEYHNPAKINSCHLHKRLFHQIFISILSGQTRDKICVISKFFQNSE